MQGLVNRIFLRFGIPAVLESAGVQTSVQVFFQFQRSNSLYSVQRIFAPTGQVPRGQYICYMPPDTGAAEGDTLLIDGRYYTVCQAEPMGGLYDRCLCVQKGGTDLWGSNG